MIYKNYNYLIKNRAYYSFLTENIKFIIIVKITVVIEILFFISIISSFYRKIWRKIVDKEKVQEKIYVNSEIEITLKMIGGKSKPLILYMLNEDGPLRFKTLMASIKQISQKTLTNQLRELEADGLILRESFNEIPPRVEYSATAKGESLMPILELMCQWGEENKDERFILVNPQCV